MLRARSFSIYTLSVLCALFFTLQFEGWPTQFVLEIDVQTDADTSLKLLFDQGSGYRNQDSIVVRLSASRAFSRVYFHLPVSELHNLDLLVYSASPFVRLRHVRLKILGGTSLDFGAESLQAGKTTTLDSRGDVIEIAGPNDHRDIAFTLRSLLRETRTCKRLRYGIFFGLWTGALALILLLSNRKQYGREDCSRSELLPRNATVILLVCVYLLSSIAKLNGSATALWRIYADREAPNAGLIVGTAKPSRSDEWVGETPWILSQIARGFPLTNLAVGEEMMPLLNNLPAWHWTMLLRPQMWGFFVANLEHAFAFYWNFKWFSLLMGAFLFLRWVAHGNSFAGLFGALLLFFSPFVQWWFSTPTCMPEMIGAFFLALWSLVVIAQAQKRWIIAAAAILLVQSVAQFVFCAYPRFQIPLIYLGLFLLAAVLIARRGRVLVEPLVRFRLCLLATATVLIAVILLFWCNDVGGAISRVHALAYPGSMFSTGGQLPWQRLFMPFLEFALTEQHYPAEQMNACEAAGFLFFAPLIAIVVMVDASRRRFDAVMVACFIFIVIGLWFMLFGFSTVVARWTGFWLVYSPRMLLPLSVASVIGLCRYLSNSGAQRNFSRIMWTALLLILGLMLFAILHSTNRKLAGFVDESVVIATSIYFAAVFATLWQRQVIVAALLVLIPTAYSTGLVNPIGSGLPGLTKSETFQWLSERRKRQPDAKWLVIGHPSSRTNFVPQFLKATGADTFGGYRCEPDQRMVRGLDPTGKYSAVYNRYAEIQFLPSAKPEPSFELTFINHYNVLLPLKPEILQRLGVTYILEVDMSAAEGAINGYSVIGERQGLRLLTQETR